MRNLFGKTGVLCSFCNKKITSDRLEILGFRFHRACADDVAEVLGKVKTFSKWIDIHPRLQSSELGA